MAGGLFGKSFVLNEKCIFFALICMVLFFYKPSFKKQSHAYLAAFGLFVVAYVAMAWYDAYYDCRIAPLQRGSGASFTRLFKPDAHIPSKQVSGSGTGPKDVYMKRFMIYASHIVFIVPLLVYVAYKKDKVDESTYTLLGSLAAFTLVYHIGKFASISSHT